MIDPQARAVLDGILAGPPLDQIGVAESRRWSAQRARATTTEVASVEDLTTDRGIPLRLYRPQEDTRSPVIVFAHGGGWILGSIDSADETCRRLAVASGCAVLSVDYRLAPEARHPAAVDDVVHVVEWLPTVADRLGLDASGVVLAGESSGAHVALCAGLQFRDAGRDVIGAQLLVCPPIDRTLSSASWRELGEDYSPRRSQMAWMWDLYLGEHDEFLAGRPDPRTADLSGLPPAVIVVAEYDPLRDEALELADRMRRAGTPVEVLVCEGQIHPVTSHAPVVDACDLYLTRIGESIRTLLMTKEVA